MSCVLCGSLMTSEEVASGHSLCHRCWSEEGDRLYPPIKIPASIKRIFLLGVISGLLALPLVCREADEHRWTSTDTLLSGAYVGVQFVDWMQTREICRHPGLRESNPVLGDHPSAGAVNRHFLKTTITDLALAYVLKKVAPPWVSRTFQSMNIGIEINCINTNRKNGIQVNLGFTF